MKEAPTLGIDNLTITCPYCETVFDNNGRPELQPCPKCHAKLLVEGGTQCPDLTALLLRPRLHGAR